MSERRERMSITQITQAVQAGAHLPPTSAVAPAQPTQPEPALVKAAAMAPAPKGKRDPHYEVVAMNFKCTPDMARLLARLSEPEGGLRRFLAKTLKAAGHDVPENDLNPPTNRRWAGGGG